MPRQSSIRHKIRRRGPADGGQPDGRNVSRPARQRFEGRPDFLIVVVNIDHRSTDGLWHLAVSEFGQSFAHGVSRQIKQSQLTNYCAITPVDLGHCRRYGPLHGRLHYRRRWIVITACTGRLS
jgi:hypothetical protein